jgi:hypothetical protein
MDKHTYDDTYLKPFVIVVVACLSFCFLFSIVMATSATMSSKHGLYALSGQATQSVPVPTAIQPQNITLTATEQKRAEDRFISALALMKASVELSTQGQKESPPFLRFWDVVLSTPDLRALYAGKAAYLEQQGTDWKEALLEALDSVFEYATHKGQNYQGHQTTSSPLSEGAQGSSSEDASLNVDGDGMDCTNKE